MQASRASQKKCGLKRNRKTFRLARKHRVADVYNLVHERCPSHFVHVSELDLTELLKEC